MRRYLIIGAVVIVLAGLGVVGYLYFANTPGVEVAPAGSTSLPIAGQEAPIDTGVIEVPETTVVNPPTLTPVRLAKISDGPVVLGEAVVNRAPTASSSREVSVSYIERQSGNVYSYLVGEGTRTRTSNRTVPGIQSAVWLPDASLAFVRYLSGDFSTINSYALPADGSDAVPAGRQGFFLSQNLSDLAVSSTSILTLASGVNGSVASLIRTDGTRSVGLFSTPLSALRIAFAGKSQYLAFTKPAAALSGGAFLVDGVGNFSRVAGPKNGLVALASPSGKWVLISYSSNQELRMELVNTTTGETLPLPVATIADKCVWTVDDSAIYCGIPVNPPRAAYPDDWYQGAVSFTDQIWKIQVSGRYAQFVLDFSKEGGGALDAEALAIDPLHTVLVFVNKNDGSLWSYSL